MSLVSIRATTDMPGLMPVRQRLIRIDADAHRDPLGNLNEIAGCIVGPQHREFGSRSRRQILDMALQPCLAECVDREGCRLADPHVACLRFLEIGSYPKRLGDQEHELRAGGHILAAANPDFTELAVQRSADHGVIEINFG